MNIKERLLIKKTRMYNAGLRKVTTFNSEHPDLTDHKTDRKTYAAFNDPFMSLSMALNSPKTINSLK